MLQAIRDRATGWIAWVIVILICIPFALWGVNQYFEPDQGLVVAKVDDTEIGYYQYRSAYEQQRARLRELFGGNLPPEVLEDGRLRREALERLIEEEVLVQRAAGNGLRVGDGQLANALLTLPTFQREGRFSQQLYEQFLHARGLSPPGFELDLRRSMLADQVAAAIERSAIVTRRELDAALAVRNEQRRVRLLRIDPAAIEVPPPSEQRIREWFEANRDRYAKPERVKVRYVELDRADIVAQVTVDEAELRAIYDERARQGQYLTPQQREARHILITVPADASPEQVQAARERIEALRGRIAAGEDFADVARESSEDPGSASLGGSLGYFGRGVMDPAFEEAAFSQAEGELGEPVRSRFGWHLIEVTDVQPEQVQTFEQARDEVLRQYQESQADQIFAEQADRLATLGFEHPQSLEPGAEALGLEPRESGFFSASGEDASGIGANPRVREVAFSDEVLEGGNNSELVDLGSGRVLVLRVAEREPARPRELDEVRDEIARLLREEDAARRAAELGEQILEALRGGASMQEVAARHGLEWAEPRAITRDDTGDVPPAAADALFRLPAPDGSAPVFGGTSLAGGGYAVMALSEVGQAPALDDAEQRRRRLVQVLQASTGREAFSAVLERLREQTEVSVYERNLSRDGG